MKLLAGDTNITIGLRKKLLEDLREILVQRSDITGYDKVLEAMNAVPRHLFLGKGFEFMAYQNQAISIDADQTISHPLTVAIQTALLDISSNHRVLEIGTGSGYQAAVLSQLALKVYSLERHEVLYKKATLRLKELECKNVSTYYRDGFMGLPALAPFDKIIITCAAPELPQMLIDQLAIGGQMVLPKNNDEGSQDMIRVTKKPDHSLFVEEFGKFVFVPMLSGTEKHTSTIS